MIEQLIYTSRAAKEMSQKDVDAVLDVARRSNQELGITGFLLYDGEHFVQLLEGDREHVEQVFDKISGDTRHSGIQALICQQAESRTFSNWSMAYAFVDENQLKKFGGSMNASAARELANLMVRNDSDVRGIIADFLTDLVAA